MPDSPKIFVVVSEASTSLLGSGQADSQQGPRTGTGKSEVKMERSWASSEVKYRQW